MSDLKPKDYEDLSDYPKLELPQFEANIPVELLKDLSPTMKHLFEQQNIQTQGIKFLCEAMIDTNTQVRRTNGRLKKVEKWKSKLSSIWSILIAGFVGISAVVTFILKLLSYI